MTRTGKIARLPRDLRHQLNRRLQDGEPGIRLVEWLNALPEVRQILVADFGGREISEQNLSEWRQGGYQDWLARQETLACARELAGDAEELAAAADGSLADHLAVVLSARYAALVSGWDGEMDDAFRRKARALRTLCPDAGDGSRDRGSPAMAGRAASFQGCLCPAAAAEGWAAYGVFARLGCAQSDRIKLNQTKSNQMNPLERLQRTRQGEGNPAPLTTGVTERA